MNVCYCVHYATSSNVYKSADAGNSFVLLPPNPGGAGTNNLEITSIDVTYLDYYIIVVGTRDTDGSEYGGVYVLNERELFTSWIDTNVGGYDVYAVAFSPNFPADRQLVAVVTDETDTFVTTKVGDAGWGATVGNARLDRDNSGIPTPVVVATSADIVFPEDYDVTMGHYVLFVAIDTGSGNGDVYRINRTVATDLDIGFAYGLSNIDVTALAVTSNAATAKLLAGTASSARVYFSSDGGRTWTRSTKEPTGQAKTFVVMAPDFSSSGKAYAATSGTESAFSYTADGGVTWNQPGLIDTKISDILDVALSPNYSQDNTLFMLTHKTGGKHSLWRSLNDGARWERVYSSALADVDSIKWVELSPQYGNGSQVVFITGKSGGNPAIWNSTDNGQNFSPPRVTRDPITGTAFSINTWAVVDDDALFVGSYNGSNGLVYHGTNGGWWYSAGAVAGNQSLYSIALSPNYDRDGTIVVGNTNGWVYWSSDDGATFEPLPPDATSPPLTGSISVAFDSQFNSNNTVYAASNTPDKGIYRFIINKSTEWESIDSTLPSGGMIGQLRLSANGTLYAINSQPVDAASKEGGMERCLNPANPLGPTFETVTHGLGDGAALTGLWLSDNKLWSIDTYNTRLMTYSDSLVMPVSLISPSNQAPGIGTVIGSTIRDVSLNWESLSGATSYQWQLDYSAGFSTVPIPLEGDTEANSTRLTALEPATTYYWRVRATEPVLSLWSASWSFTTSLGTTVTAPSLKSPGSGAKRVELKPVFQWSAIAGAESYELLVSTNVSFVNPIIAKSGGYALPTTAWQSDIGLDYDTTYYWKVRAISPTTRSAWSAVSAFTTRGTTVIAPSLKSPGSGAKRVELRPIFQWSAIAGAESYELLVSTNVSFVNPIIAKSGGYALLTTAWQSDISLNYDTTYYWKVRAIGSDGYSAWSAVSAFITRSSPVSEPLSSLTAPNLVSPEAGASGVGLKPIFQWSAIAGADSYELLVSTNVSFVNPIIAKSGGYALLTTAWQSDISLNYDTTYYWKVRAIGSDGYSAWSAVNAFITRSSPVSEPLSSLTAPNLVSPEAGVSDVGLKPIFQWSAIAGADSYELLVSTDVSFATPIIIKIGAYTLSTTAWQCDINLDYDTTYYWKVRATGSGSSSAWSAISAFATEAPPAQSEPSPAQGSSSPAQGSSPPAQESPSSPSVPSQPDTPDWVIYLMGLMGFIIILLFITILVVVVRQR